MLSASHSALNIVAALSCEARALVDYYGLHKVVDRPFTLFQSKPSAAMQGPDMQGPQVNLVLSGVGLINSAAAVAWLGARTTGQQAVWLNVGTAGHKEQEVGRLNLIHAVQQVDSTRKHYPPLVAEWAGNTMSLLSCNALCSEYPAEQAVDMEASAFFYVAGKFSDNEVIQSVKVISDNETHGVEHLNARYVQELLKPHTQEIVNYAERLMALNCPVLAGADELSLIKHLRCTVSQKALYQELVSKHRALGLFEQTQQNAIGQAGSMSIVIQQLRDGLSKSAPLAVPIK